jgi:hypothetical protein
MVNTDMLNARIACSIRPDFCVFLLDSGRFLLIKKPVKYTRIFDINQSKVRRLRSSASIDHKKRQDINTK